MPSTVSLYEKINAHSLNLLGALVDTFPDLRHNPKKAYILCYHSVANSGWRFATSVQDFKEQIEYLSKNFDVISLQEVLDGKPGIAITFDDGYEDNLLNAFPILQKNNCSAAIFMIGNPKQADRKRMENSYPLLSTSQLRQLRAAGWEIGFHTSTHSDLSLLTENELIDELEAGKQQFELQTGSHSRYFAYPYGLYNDHVIHHVQQAGFKAAFTINGGAAKTVHPFIISRVAVEGNMTLQQFRGLVSPLGAQLYRFFITVLRLKAEWQSKLQKASS